MKAARQHRFLILTKRAARMREFLWRWTGACLPLPNVWVGVSVENQEAANSRVPHLLETPAAVRWISAEPLLGPVNLRAFPSRERGRTLDALTGRLSAHPLTGARATTPSSPRIDWIVAGGETGPHATPCHPDWARGLRNQAQSAGVPFFWKSWGDWAPVRRMTALRPREDAGQVVRVPVSSAASPFGFLTVAVGEDAQDDAGEVDVLERLGRKRAGRELDGRTHDEMPEVARG
jgi:protein gp37